MKGFCIRFYLRENKKKDGILLYEWLIEKAKEIGIEGGSVFKAISALGHDKVIREENFFELGANVSVEVMFVLPEEEKNNLFEIMKNEALDIFYVISSVEYDRI